MTILNRGSKVHQVKTKYMRKNMSDRDYAQELAEDYFYEETKQRRRKLVNRATEVDSNETEEEDQSALKRKQVQTGKTISAKKY